MKQVWVEATETCNKDKVISYINHGIVKGVYVPQNKLVAEEFVKDLLKETNLPICVDIEVKRSDLIRGWCEEFLDFVCDGENDIAKSVHKENLKKSIIFGVPYSYENLAVIFSEIREKGSRGMTFNVVGVKNEYEAVLASQAGAQAVTLCGLHSTSAQGDLFCIKDALKDGVIVVGDKLKVKPTVIYYADATNQYRAAFRSEVDIIVLTEQILDTSFN